MNSRAQQSTIDAYSISIFAHVVFKPVWGMSIFPTKSLSYRHSHMCFRSTFTRKEWLRIEKFRDSAWWWLSAWDQDNVVLRMLEKSVSLSNPRWPSHSTQPPCFLHDYFQVHHFLTSCKQNAGVCGAQIWILQYMGWKSQNCGIGKCYWLFYPHLCKCFSNINHKGKSFHNYNTFHLCMVLWCHVLLNKTSATNIS